MIWRRGGDKKVKHDKSWKILFKTIDPVVKTKIDGVTYEIDFSKRPVDLILEEFKKLREIEELSKEPFYQSKQGVKAMFEVLEDTTGIEMETLIKMDPNASLKLFKFINENLRKLVGAHMAYIRGDATPTKLKRWSKEIWWE